MSNKLYLFLVFCTLQFYSQAQNITIKGIAKTYENKEIGAWVAKDFISNTQKQLTFSTIDSAGNFLLEFNSKEIQYLTLKIDKSIASLYVEPNKNYEVIIMPPDSTTYENPNLEHDVKISINLKSKTEINALTIDYDKRFDDFLTREYKAFVTRTPQQKIDTFKLAMSNYYADVKNSYFDAYRTYTIAALEEKTGVVSKKKLFEAYLDQKPVLYNNPEYFNFFNAFYTQYLKNLTQKKEAILVKQINSNNSYDGVMNILKLDVHLKNDTIRELLLIKGLYESYYDGTFKKESIVKLLEYIADKGKIAENKQIAQNILNSFSKLKPGALAPFFELPDKEGQNHNLDELRAKKFVYLFFFDQQCTACFQQMKIMSSLKKLYGTRIQFVGISVDKSNVDFKEFCAKAEYDWLFLFDNTGKKLQNDYELKSLPSYFLIDSDGKFIQAPADSPDGDIDRVFYDITKSRTKKHLVGDRTNK
jgi:peroxiredoxin